MNINIYYEYDNNIHNDNNNNIHLVIYKYLSMQMIHMAGISITN